MPQRRRFWVSRSPGKVVARYVDGKVLKGYADFDPNQTVPVPAGGFVRRVAHTPHYDGVKRDAKEPAVIALFGIAPVDLTLVDPSKPGWRQV